MHGSAMINPFLSFVKFFIVKRESYWMTSSCLSQFRGWKIPILIGDLERPIKYLKDIKWSNNLQVQYIGSSWTYQYHLVLPFMSSFLTIFQLYGVRRTWWSILIFEGASCWATKIPHFIHISYTICHLIPILSFHKTINIHHFHE